MNEKANELTDKVIEVAQNNVSQALALVYGIGMLSWTAFSQMNSNYWSYFLTDICGLEASVMGTVKTLSGIGSWIMAIVAAVVVEKVWLRHGQYRSWLLYAPIVTIVAYLLTWLNPVDIIGVEATSIYMIVFYMLGSFGNNFFMIAATAIVPAVCNTEHDAALMSQRKAQGNMLVKVCFAAISLPCILLLNSAIYGVSYDEGKSAGPAGFTICAAILGILVVALFYMLFKKFDGMDPTQKICEERYRAKKNGEEVPPIPKKDSMAVGEMLKLWITNIPALVALFADTIRFIAQMTIQSMSIYVFTYAYNDVSMTAVMLTAANIVGLLGTFASEPIVNKLGVRPTSLIGQAISGGAMIACFFIGATSMWAFIACICVCYFGMNFMNGCMVGSTSNAIAYGEWRDGKCPRAWIMSTWQWCPQIANAVAGALTGFGLASIGFVKGMASSPELVQGMINIVSMIPAIGFVISFVLFFFLYPLGKKRMEQINNDLAARHAAEEKSESELEEA